MFNAKYLKEVLEYISDDIMIDDDFIREIRKLEVKGINSKLTGTALRSKYNLEQKPSSVKIIDAYSDKYK